MNPRNYKRVILLLLCILPATIIAQNNPNRTIRNYYCISPLSAAMVNATGTINFYVKDYNQPDLSKIEFYITENGQTPGNVEGIYLTYNKSLADGGVMIGVSWTNNRTFFIRDAAKFADSRMFKLYINRNLRGVQESAGPITIVSSLGGSAKDIEGECMRLNQTVNEPPVQPVNQEPGTKKDNSGTKKDNSVNNQDYSGRKKDNSVVDKDKVPDERYRGKQGPTTKWDFEAPQRIVLKEGIGAKGSVLSRELWNHHVVPDEDTYRLLQLLNPGLINKDNNQSSSLQLALPYFPPTNRREQASFAKQEIYDHSIDNSMNRKFITNILAFDKYLRKLKPAVLGKQTYDNLMTLESVFTRYMKSNEPPPLCRSVATSLNDEIESCNNLMVDILIGVKKDMKLVDGWVAAYRQDIVEFLSLYGKYKPGKGGGSSQLFLGNKEVYEEEDTRTVNFYVYRDADPVFSHTDKQYKVYCLSPALYSMYKRGLKSLKELEVYTCDENASVSSRELNLLTYHFVAVLESTGEEQGDKIFDVKMIPEKLNDPQADKPYALPIHVTTKKKSN